MAYQEAETQAVTRAVFDAYMEIRDLEEQYYSDALKLQRSGAMKDAIMYGCIARAYKASADRISKALGLTSNPDAENLQAEGPAKSGTCSPSR